jgi:hypothetical protein
MKRPSPLAALIVLLLVLFAAWAFFWANPLNRASLRLMIADYRNEAWENGAWSGPYTCTSPTDAAMAFMRSDPSARILELRPIPLRNSSSLVYGALAATHRRTIALIIVHENGNKWSVRGSY